MRTVSEILKSRKDKKNAFTMIELLVVVAIIGILIAAIVVAFVSARQKSRDARRKTDLKNIQVSLQLYSDDNHGNFPNSLDRVASEGYMTSVPNDPGTQESYKYVITSNKKEYAIGAILENKKDDALEDDFNGTMGGVSFMEPHELYGIKG